MRFGWIRRHRDRFEASAMCRALRVSRGGRYAWVDRPPGGRAKRRGELVGQARRAHERSMGT